jgi:hypothetical protein
MVSRRPKVLDDETTEKIKGEIIAQTTNLYGAGGGYNLATMVGHQGRWVTNARMFYRYARNVVFLNTVIMAQE